jgi:hypothetical protein
LKNQPHFAARLLTSVYLTALADLVADACALLRKSSIRRTERSCKKKCRYKYKPPAHDFPP